MRLALLPVPNYTRWGFYLQVLVILVCLFGLQWWPLIPTVAIGFLGVVAVIMAVRADHFSHTERVVWTLIAVALFIAEMRAVYRDRDEHDSQQAEARQREEREFREIAGGISKAIEKSDRNFAQTMAGISDAIKGETGGDSFAFITFTPEPNQQFLVAITSHGKYPLREVHATMIDEERRLQAMQEFNKHPEGNWIAAIQVGDTEFRVPYLRPQSAEAPSGDVEMLGGYPFGSKDANDLTIAFSSLNGYWNERLHLRKVNGQWHQALSLMGPTAKQALHPFIYFDSDYPEGKALAEKDWPRVKQKSKDP
jgi:hypothetical protein